MTISILQRQFAAAQAIDKAETVNQVLQALHESLALLSDQVNVTIYRESESISAENAAHVELAGKALRSQQPEQDQTGCVIAIPLIAEQTQIGVAVLEKSTAFTDSEVASVLPLIHLTAHALERLTWPASPLVFRQLVERANVAIDVADINGLITYANMAAARMYGFALPQQLIGKNVSELYEENEEDKVKIQIAEDRINTTGWIGELMQHDADGSPFPVELALFGLQDPRLKSASYGAILQDITESRRLLHSLKKQTRRLEALNKISALISSSLDRNRILDIASEQLVTLFQVDHCAITITNHEKHTGEIVAEYPANRIKGIVFQNMGNPIFELHQEQRYFVSHDVPTDPRLENMRDVLDSFKVKSILIARLEAKDRIIGSIGLHTTRSAHAFTNEEIDMLETLAGQIALAIENSDLYTQALAANKLKSDFLANISHELRTPLNSILGYNEMVLSGMYGDLNDKQRDRLSRVFNNSQNLLALINDILDLAKIDAGRMILDLETVDLAQLINSTVDTLMPRAQSKQIELRMELPDSVPTISGDVMRLRQILLNLLSNAVKFTREGSVTVHVDQFTVERGQSTYPVRANIRLKDANWLAIAVIDTGIGIAPENHDLIFDAFRQVDGSTAREFEGTGLGLAIARQLAEMHGGALWVESAIGTGSTFTLALPVS